MKFVKKIFNLINSFLVKRTVGVRALIVDDKKVLLVQHTYLPQWYTVGGAVEKGETPLQALKRELYEEVGAICTEEPKLFSVYFSNNEKRDDYIIFYIVENNQFTASNSPEIQEKKWFEFENLPEDVSPATRKRINEYLTNNIASDKW